MPTGFGHREISDNPLPLSVQWNYDHRVRDEKNLTISGYGIKEGGRSRDKKCLLSEHKQKNISVNIHQSWARLSTNSE